MKNIISDNDFIKIGRGGLEGKPETLKKAAPWILVIAGVYLGVRGVIRWLTDNNKTNNNIREGHEHSKDKINESHERAGDKIKVSHEATEDQIKIEVVKSELKREEIEARGNMRIGVAERIQKIRKRFANKMRAVKSKIASKKLSNREWLARFNAKFQKPDFSKIPIISTVLDMCPDGFEVPALISMLVNFGGLCFSVVRAELNGTEQAPTIQHVVVAKRGSGKSYIYHLYNRLFARVIEQDNKNMQENNRRIIQTVGLQATISQFFEILSKNFFLHIVSNETEIDDVAEALSKTNGFRKNYLRKGFSFEPIEKNTRDVRSNEGRFGLNLSYNFAGTPNGVAEFYSKKEVENGTASRVFFTVIPELDDYIPQLRYPTGDELQKIQNQIDSWRKQYCYYEKSDGDEAICQIKEIDLGFVEKVLIFDWDIEQCELAEREGDITRKDHRSRVRDIAFRCAMVLYMMAGCPDDSQVELRQNIIDITIYLANYCMERYLYMFGDIENPKEQDGNKPQHLTQEQIEHWYPLHGTLDEQGNEISYKYIARECGIDNRQDVINDFKRYKKKLRSA